MFLSPSLSLKSIFKKLRLGSIICAKVKLTVDKMSFSLKKEF